MAASHKRSIYRRSLLCLFCEIFIVSVVCLYDAVDASVCKKLRNVQNDAGILKDVPVQESTLSPSEYKCPGHSDPKHYTECCGNDLLQRCCAQARYFYEIDKTLATIIAISVTLAFVIFTTAIIVCCFWSRCPLYSACRVQYTSEIATYASKADNLDMSTMPRDMTRKGQKKFVPVAVANENLPVSAEIEYV